MREQLTSYVDLLFAGADNAYEIKQEILQNTLDRYDDLIGQGKAPEAAYRLAISGIGDINEIFGNDVPRPVQAQDTGPATGNAEIPTGKPVWKKMLTAIGICLYIMCPIPLVVLQDTTGLCGLLTFVAAATALVIISGGKRSNWKIKKDPAGVTQKSKLREAIDFIIWTIGLCCYFILSFLTQAWYITWVIFLLIGAIQGLVTACIDLKEAQKNED